MATKYWVGGNGTWNASATTNWSDTDGGAGGAVAPTSADDVVFNGNSDIGAGFTVTISTGAVCNDITVSGLDQSMIFAGSGAWSIFGSLSYPATNLSRTYTGAITFSSTSSETITTNGVAITSGLVTFNGVGGSWVLGSAFTKTGAITQTNGNVDLNGYSMTCTGAYTLTNNTLTLNNQTLTCQSFSSNNSNIRSIAFVTSGKIVVNGTGSLFDMGTVTNFSYTGTPRVELTNNTATSRSIIILSTAPESQVLDFYITAGTGAIGGSHAVGTLDFTGFSGSYGGSTNRRIYRNLTLSPTMTVTTGTGTTTFAGTGEQLISGNSISYPHAIAQVGAGGTVRLITAFNQESSFSYNQTAGTIDLNGQTLAVGTWSTTGSTARNISFNGGDIDVAGGWTASGSNFTTSGSGTINMTSGSSKTFSGGGFTYSCALNQGGAGNLTITGANTFANITNTVQPCTVIFPSSTITNLSQFDLNGTASNLVSIRSSTNGVQATINML